jgi:hypothetical protein
VRLLTGSRSDATLLTRAQRTTKGLAGRPARCAHTSTSGVNRTAVVSSESVMVTRAPRSKKLRKRVRPWPLAARAHRSAAHSKKPLLSKRRESKSSARRNKRASFPAARTARAWLGRTSPSPSASAAPAQVHHASCHPRGRRRTPTSVRANSTNVRMKRTVSDCEFRSARTTGFVNRQPPAERPSATAVPGCGRSAAPSRARCVPDSVRLEPAAPCLPQD